VEWIILEASARLIALMNKNYEKTVTNVIIETLGTKYKPC